MEKCDGERSERDEEQVERERPHAFYKHKSGFSDRGLYCSEEPRILIFIYIAKL